MKKIAGYTLVELVAVILVMVIVVAVATPSFNKSAYDARLLADQLVQALWYARQVAVACACGVQVSYDETNTKFTFKRAAYQLADYVNGIVDPSSETLSKNFEVTVPKGVTVNTTTLPFIFKPEEGTVDSKIEITIGTYTVIVEKDSGYVHI